MPPSAQPPPSIQRRQVSSRPRRLIGAVAHTSPWVRYEHAKARWAEANPGATPAEYEAAMRRIADEVGV